MKCREVAKGGGENETNSPINSSQALNRFSILITAYFEFLGISNMAMITSIQLTSRAVEETGKKVYFETGKIENESRHNWSD